MTKHYKNKITKLTPVERAVLRQKWSQSAVQAQLHALMGENVERIADRAGSLFYVVLWACNAGELLTDDRDRRVIRGAVMQLVDLDGKTAITELQRNAVHAGLEAVTRLFPRLNVDHMVMAECALFETTKARAVTLRDFPPADFPAIHHPAA